MVCRVAILLWVVSLGFVSAVQAAGLSLSFVQGPTTVVEWTPIQVSETSFVSSAAEVAPVVQTVDTVDTPAEADSAADGDQPATGESESAGGQQFAMMLNLRSNTVNGYTVSVSHSSVGGAKSTLGISLQGMSNGQVTESAVMPSGSESDVALKFAGDAVERTGDATSTPDQVRVAVNTPDEGMGAAPGQENRGMDVITMIIAPN